MGKPAQQKYQAMKEVYQDDCLGQSTILYWYNFFIKSRESAVLEPHSGWPASIVIETNIKTFAAIIRDDRHMSVRMVESMVHISKSSIHRIFSEHLQMCRVYSIWVPHFLKCEQVEQRVEVVKQWVRNFSSKVSHLMKLGSLFRP